MRNLQGKIGRRLDIVHVFHMWQDPFPSSSDLAFLRQGSMLLLSWSGTDTLAVAAGRYDGWIRQRALAIKAADKRIFLEWRWEMDRPGLRAQIHSPAAYIAAWDHIRSIFAQEHVDNVAWVWCPTASGFANGTAAAYYPGDNEVNWVCADAYPGPGPYRSFATVVQPFLDWASHHRKPVMIGEYGVPDTYGPQQRAQWLWGAARTGAGQRAGQGAGLLRRQCEARLRAAGRLARAAGVSRYRARPLLQPGQSASALSLRAFALPGSAPVQGPYAVGVTLGSDFRGAPGGGARLIFPRWRGVIVLAEGLLDAGSMAAAVDLWQRMSH